MGRCGRIRVLERQANDPINGTRPLPKQMRFRAEHSADASGWENLSIGLATAADRIAIYRIRHAVYATELKQHAQNAEGTLRDPLDAFNQYIVAKLGEQVIGFISIT